MSDAQGGSPILAGRRWWQEAEGSLTLPEPEQWRELHHCLETGSTSALQGCDCSQLWGPVASHSGALSTDNSSLCSLCRACHVCWTA